MKSLIRNTVRKINPEHDRILDLWAEGYSSPEIVSKIDGTSKAMVNAVIWEWRKLGDPRAVSRKKAPCPDPITREFVLSLFTYDRANGELRWLRSDGKARRGALAGCSNHLGYRRVNIGGNSYPLHHLIWLIETGEFPDLIDHRDTDPSNSRFSNLREATAGQNCANQGLRSDNTSGFKGVHFRKAAGPNSKQYFAWIAKDYKRFYLGDFWTAREAADAYARAAEKLHGEFARVA